MKTFDERWEQVHNEREWGKYPLEEVIRFVARNFYRKDRASTRILDVGCGGGAHTWFLAREGFRTVAFDGSKEAVRKASALLRNEGLAPSFAVADAGELPFRSGTFHGIVDSGMLTANRTGGIRQILGEMFRVLMKEGKIFVTVMFRRGMTGYGQGEKLEEHTFRQIPSGPLAGIGTIHFFERDEIIDLFREAGFVETMVDFLARSDRGGTSQIEYFLAEARKP